MASPSVLEQENAALRAENVALKERVAALEQRVGELERRLGVTAQVWAGLSGSRALRDKSCRYC
jgi:cell division protein FtsB